MYAFGERPRFYDSSLVQHAVVRTFQTIEESTQRLSDSVKATEPEVPLHASARLRKVLMHDYFEINLEATWSVVDHSPRREAVGSSSIEPSVGG